MKQELRLNMTHCTTRTNRCTRVRIKLLYTGVGGLTACELSQTIRRERASLSYNGMILGLALQEQEQPSSAAWLTMNLWRLRCRLAMLM